jgi:hypothetical protein
MLQWYSSFEWDIFYQYFNLKRGENIVQRAKGAKVKVFLQGLHMTRVIFVLVYNLKICISSTPFNTVF